MSWENHREAWCTKLGNLTAKSVLIYLLEEGNSEGLALANMDRCAALTEAGKRTVVRIAQAFCEIGLVERSQMLLHGRLRPAFQVNLEMLGKDLTAEFDAAYVALQSKKRKDDGTLEFVPKRRSDTGEPTLDFVAATEESVAATVQDVAATFPPHPHIGVPPSVPLKPLPPNPPQAGGAAADEPEIALTPEQQEHLDRIGDAPQRGTWLEYYRRENREAAERQAQEAAAARAELVRDVELEMLMPRIDDAIAWTLQQCGWVEDRPGRGVSRLVRAVMASEYLAGSPCGSPWHRTAARIAENWRKWLESKHLMRVPYGAKAWLKEGLWRDQRAWPWDQDKVRRRAEAGVGSRW